MDFPKRLPRAGLPARPRPTRWIPSARGVLPAARHERPDPRAALTPQFIPTAMRGSHGTPEGDQMPRTAALFARQLLAAAERDSRSPREAPGTPTRPPRAGLPETGRRRWAVLAVARARRGPLEGPLHNKLALLLALVRRNYIRKNVVTSRDGRI